jgi:hypothetical protein
MNYEFGVFKYLGTNSSRINGGIKYETGITSRRSQGLKSETNSTLKPELLCGGESRTFEKREVSSTYGATTEKEGRRIKYSYELWDLYLCPCSSEDCQSGLVRLGHLTRTNETLHVGN